MEKETPPGAIIGALRAMGLLPADAPLPAGRALTGGVSSDIWLVELSGRILM